MRFFYFLFVATIIVACEEKQEPVNKAWIFQKVEFTEGETDYSVEAINPMNLDVSSFLDLQEGGKYTSYFGHFDQGEWELKHDTLLLKPSGGWLIIPFKVQSNKNGKMQLFYNPRKAIYTFEGFENSVFNSGLENPFSYSNNKWRQKPETRESDEEIAARLKNHFRFYETYFRWGKSLDKERLLVNNFPGPLTIYGNALELIPSYRYSYSWQQCFYDTSDCNKAYEMLYYHMYSKEIKWPETKNRFEWMISAFNQLQGWMNTVPEIYKKRRAVAMKQEEK